MNFQYPLNWNAITVPFRNPGHLGIDLGWNRDRGGENVSIFSVGDGIVTNVINNRNRNMSNSSDTGNLVRIDHGRDAQGNIWESRYIHLLRGSISVTRNQRVTRNQQIGRMNNSGFSNGSHLHFDLYRNGIRVNPVLFLQLYPHQEVNSNTERNFNILRFNPNIPPQPFRVGQTVTTMVALNVRAGAGTNHRQLRRNELTADGQRNSQNRADGLATLNNGTRVTILELRNVGNDIWARIPSGWVALRYNGNMHVRV